MFETDTLPSLAEQVKNPDVYEVLPGQPDEELDCNLFIINE